MLNKIKASPNVKELVIAGDLVDEWFVPANVDTYQGKDQADFVRRVAAANKGVFDALQGIIYANDSQIISLDNVKKIYGLRPRVEIELEIL